MMSPTNIYIYIYILQINFNVTFCCYMPIIIFDDAIFGRAISLHAATLN